MQGIIIARMSLCRAFVAIIAVAGTVAGWTATVLAQGKPAVRVELRPVASVDAAELVRINQELLKQGLPPFRSIRRMPAPERGLRIADRMIEAAAPGQGVRPWAIAPPVPPPQPLGPIPGTDFQALLDNFTSIPPDTHGTAGPEHLLTMLNTEVNIQTKDGVPLVGWPILLEAFWLPTGAKGFFDPRIIYDPGAGEWIAIVLSGGDQPDENDAHSQVHLAIHPGVNPSVGAWTFFNIPADPGGVDDAWADFPDVGVNDKWVAITVNMFSISRCLGGINDDLPCKGNDELCPGGSCEDGEFIGVKMWVIERPVPLGGPVGPPAGLHIFPTAFDTSGGYNTFTLRPCLTFGGSDTLYLVDVVNGIVDAGTGRKLLRLSELNGAVAAPAWSVTPGSAYGAATGFFIVPATGDFNIAQVGAPQLGAAPGQRIDTGDARLQNAVFRNDRVWCTHSGGRPAQAANTRTAVFWYELDPAAMPNPIVQSGDIDGGDMVHHFYPSISANARNDMLIGFSRCDATKFAEGVYTGRHASDPAGTVNVITVLKAGVDTYIKGFPNTIRWGDYSATVVDPADDLTFWTIQEYAEADVGPNPSDDRWGTWWGSATLFPPPDGDLLYDNFRPLDDFGQPASQKAVDVPFFAETADDFVLPGEGNNLYLLDQVRFATVGADPVFWDGVKITIYLDGERCEEPGPLDKGPAGEPAQDGSREHFPYCLDPYGVVCELKVPMDDHVFFQDLPEIVCSGPAFDIRCFDLKPFGCTLDKNQKYWIAIAPEVDFNPFGQTYLVLSANNLDHPAQQFFPLAGINTWTKIPGNMDACPDAPPAGFAQDIVLQIFANKEPFVPSCPWDCFDGNGDVGLLDFLALLAEWGLVGAPCDFNGDGVNIVDFLKLLGHWGPCP
jgi:hypothetical protein